jgi:FkbM family methyltransferase
MIDDLLTAGIRAAPFGYWRLARMMRAARPSLGWHQTPTRYGTMMCDVGEPACFPLVKFGRFPHWADDEALIERLSPRDVVVDVGANVGAMTRLFARTAQVVHAFEPSPKALRFLKANAPSNTVIHPVALSDFTGAAKFAERESFDLSSFADEGIEVPVRTLDSFGLKPSLIKIDVEGFEPEVIRGARETLKHSPLILFEALTKAKLAECQAEILSANPAYEIERVSAFNCLAMRRRVRGRSGRP